MALDPVLLEVLACPVCHGHPLTPVGNETGLRCEGCRRVYPVEDGIPVMLPEEAKVEGEAVGS